MTDWMKTLPDDVNIADVTLPGTHNSCARCVDFGYFTKCQNMTVSEQLRAGIRMLDIRIELDGDIIKTVHSVIDCRKKPFGRQKLLFDDVLADISGFLTANPSETVIVLVNRDDGPASDVTFAAFYRKFVENNKLWFTENRFPMLGEVRGRAVLLNRCSLPRELDADRCGLDFSPWQASDTAAGEFGKAELKNSAAERCSYYLQDTYKASPRVKWETAVKPFIENAPRDESAIINYFSANDAIHSPRMTAKYNIGKYLTMSVENGRKLGWLLFDYPTDEVIRKTITANDYPKK